MKPVIKNSILLLVIILSGILVIHSQKNLTEAGYSTAANNSNAANTLNAAGQEKDIYIPEVPYLKFISLGHDGLVADLVLARALTYYGSHYHQRKAFGFKYLKKMFVTALQMDPRNRDAFLMANNLLSGINIHDSIDIMKMGMDYHPDYWKFPEMIGFDYFYHLKDPHSAAQYYEKAAALPGHPPYVPSLSGKFYRESGRYEDALRVLNNFYTTTDDKRLKQSFKDSIEAIVEQVRQKQFQLNAVVTQIIDPVTVRFRPDTDNPQFRFLHTNETLRVVGLAHFPSHSPDQREQLFNRFQMDYARWLLKETPVRIRFERSADGRLRKDKQGVYLGTIILRDGSYFQEHALRAGMYRPMYVYSFFESTEEKSKLEKAVSDAQKEKAGLMSFPPPEIPLKEITHNVGRLVTLRFRVNRVDVMGETVYLRSAPDYATRMNAVIPPGSARYFQKLSKDSHPPVTGIDYFKALNQKQIIITGFSGVKGQIVEINVHYSLQLNVLTEK